MDDLDASTLPRTPSAATLGPCAGHSGAPRLLVSVRDSAEALAALAGGADIIDIKEPSRGPLGIADPDVINRIVHCVTTANANVPVSAALGETRDWTSCVTTPSLPPDLAFVKLGLAGMARSEDWNADWLAVRLRFDSQAGHPLDWIAVAYADPEAAGSPAVIDVIRAAAHTGCRGVLIDTWSKQQPGLRAFAGDQEIQGWIQLARSSGLLVALAGRLSARDFVAPSLRAADVLGVRSAACTGEDRLAAVSAARVSELHELLQRVDGEADPRVEEAAAFIRTRWSRRPAVGIILGTGLGRFVDAIDIESAWDYHKLPHFPNSTAPGHAGRLVCGLVNGVPLVALAGRCHLYEGYSVEHITFPLRVLVRLGIGRLIVSNAAGGLNPRLSVGDVVLIDDHLNLTFDAPRPAHAGDARRPVDLGRAYDRELIALSEQVAAREDFRACRGTYAAVTGPNYETRAEYRMYRRLGADVIGMSTVPEVIVAAELGLPVLAISTVTNVCKSDTLAETDGASVAAAAAGAEWKLRKIVQAVLRSLQA